VILVIEQAGCLRTDAKLPLYTAISTNMTNGNTMLQRDLRDKQPSVAMRRIFLAAH
jgi:hypothetical protein